jgi:hypothetical protein
MAIQLYHDLVENLFSNPCPNANYQLHLIQILLSVLTIPSKHYGIEVFPYQDHVEEVEEKARR